MAEKLYYLTSEMRCTTHRMKKAESGCDRESLTLKSKPLVTDKTSEGLNDEELRLLSKGPKFIISNKMDEKMTTEYKVTFQRLAYQIRWACAIPVSENDSCNNNFVSFQAAKEFKTPNLIPNLEKELRHHANDFNAIVRASKQKVVKPNLSKNERNCLRQLKEKDITLLPSDKGGEFCAIDTESYNKAVKLHLDETSAYKRTLNHDVSKTASLINVEWAKICRQRKIPLKILRHFKSNDARTPRLYGLIKTHKEAPTPQIRPIVNAIESPGYKLSWLIYRITSPILINTIYAHLKDSMQLIQELEQLDSSVLREFPHPMSLDVCSMYTSIPVSEAIEATVRKLEECKFKYHGITCGDIKILLCKILNNMYFRFEDRTYKQVRGLAMGSRLSGLLATVFMDSLERLVVNSHQIPFYRRYVDDTLILARDGQHAQEIFNAFSLAHPAIKFEMEQAKGGTLYLLDVSVSISGGRLKVGFYQKESKSDIFVHKFSSLPTRSKQSIIVNERRRIKDRCRHGSEEEKQNLMLKLDDKLRRNGYKERDIIESKTNKRDRNGNHTQPRWNKQRPFFFSAPFVSDDVDYKLRRLFQKMKIPVIIAHKGKTLRQALQKRLVHNERCTISNCITPLMPFY